MPSVGDMASNATTTNASTSIATTVAKAAGHAVVETVTAVASQVRESNSADLKDIVSNVSKEVAAAKAEDAPTLAEKVEEASKEVAKDVVTGLESAAKDVEAHPELIVEGAVVAAVGAVGFVAPALAVGGGAVLGKMAADSAMKTIDGIATDSSSKLVKEISSDLAKDVADAKKPLDALASTHVDVTVKAKAVATVDGGEATTAKTDVQVNESRSIARDGTNSVAAASTGASPEEASEKPVIVKAVQSIFSTVNGSSVEHEFAPATTLEADSQSIVAAAVAVATVATKQPTLSAVTTAVSPAVSTNASVTSPAIVSPAVVSTSQKLTTTSKTPHLLTSNIEVDSKSPDATILNRITKDGSVADLHQKLDLITDSLQHKDLTELYQKMDAMHATLQTIAVLLTSIAQGPTQLQAQIPTSSQPRSGVEVSGPDINPPKSLITPPLPPTTVETLSEMALRNDQDIIATVGTSEARTTPLVAPAGNISKRSGVIDGLGKLFYLRS